MEAGRQEIWIRKFLRVLQISKWKIVSIVYGVFAGDESQLLREVQKNGLDWRRWNKCHHKPVHWGGGGGGGWKPANICETTCCESTFENWCSTWETKPRHTHKSTHDDRPNFNRLTLIQMKTHLRCIGTQYRVAVDLAICPQNRSLCHIHSYYQLSSAKCFETNSSQKPGKNVLVNQLSWKALRLKAILLIQNVGVYLAASCARLNNLHVVAMLNKTRHGGDSTEHAVDKGKKKKSHDIYMTRNIQPKYPTRRDMHESREHTL
jgi:hypothetical protein